MLLSKTKTLMLAMVTGAVLFTFDSAKAANDFYAPADLVLYFQNPGGSTGSDQTIMLSLGNSATVFRDASSNLINIANIGSQLSSTFGSSWYDQTTLYMGAAANRGTSALAGGHVNGDPSRTIYISQSRDGVGTAGEANSLGYSIGSFTGPAGSIDGMNAVLEANGTTAAEVFDTGTSQVDDRNPVSSGVQGTAFGSFTGGVQYQFTSSSFGSFGAAGNVEGVLDLYRIQAKNDVSGQYGFGEPTGPGEYLGSLAIDQSGNVSFITPVPEPSTYALLGLGAAVALFIKARRRKAQA